MNWNNSNLLKENKLMPIKSMKFQKKTNLKRSHLSSIMARLKVSLKRETQEKCETSLKLNLY